MLNVNQYELLVSLIKTSLSQILHEEKRNKLICMLNVLFSSPLYVLFHESGSVL